MRDQLIIFDTTMRDGEQSPGAAMTREEKVRIGKQLEKRSSVFIAVRATGSRGSPIGGQLSAPRRSTPASRLRRMRSRSPKRPNSFWSACPNPRR